MAGAAAAGATRRPRSAATPPTQAHAVPSSSARRDIGDIGDGGDGLLDAAAQGHGIGAGGQHLHALAEDALGQDGRGRRAVAGDVVRLRGDFAHHLGAHVLEAVLELDFLGDGDAVLGDGGRAEALLKDHIPALGTESHTDGSGQLADTTPHRFLGFLVESNDLRAHGRSPVFCIGSQGFQASA